MSITSDANMFSYQILEEPSKYIRVLRILPGIGSILQCSLTHVSLRKGSHVCLSYCWGTQEATHDIAVNGYQFRVRPNIYNFLYTARNRGLTHLFWIDAISINQADDVEKSVQVGMMGEIYHCATKTIVWLGPPPDYLDELSDLRSVIAGEMCTNSTADNNIAFETRLKQLIGEVRQLLSMALASSRLEGDGLDPSLWTFQYRFRTLEESRIGHELWRGISSNRTWIELFARFLETWSAPLKHLLEAYDALKWVYRKPYWSRAWITQEIMQSPHSYFLTTTTELRVIDVLDMFLLLAELWNFSDLTSVAAGSGELAELCEKTHFHVTHLSFDRWKKLNILRRNIAIFKMEEGSKGLSILQALDLTTKSHCLDPRDRIFSICSFLSEEHRLKVDYTISREDLFLEIVAKYVSDLMDGRGLCEAIRRLEDALEISPPSIESMRSQRFLLTDLLATDGMFNKAEWALPEPFRIETATGLRCVETETLCGLYTAINTGKNSCIVLEILFEPPLHGKQGVERSWLRRRKERPRTWVLKERTWTLHEGKDFNYSWSE